MAPVRTAFELQFGNDSHDFGGTAKKESREALLQRSKQERLHRQEQQHRIDAAVRIQSWLRRRRECDEARVILRDRFNTLWLQYTAALPKQFVSGNDDACSHRLSHMSNLLHFFHNHNVPGDDQRLLALCAAIVKSATDPSVVDGRQYFHAPLSTKPCPRRIGYNTWSRQAYCLARLCLSTLLRYCGLHLYLCSHNHHLAKPTVQLGSGQISDRRSFALILTCFTTIMDMSKWRRPADTAKQVHDVWWQVYEHCTNQYLCNDLHSLLIHLGQAHISTTIDVQLDKQFQQQNRTFITSVVSVPIRAVQSTSKLGGTLTLESSMRLLAHCLTIPNISSYVSASLLAEMSRDDWRLLNDLLTSAQLLTRHACMPVCVRDLIVDWTNQHQQSQWLILLANMVQLTHAAGFNPLTASAELVETFMATSISLLGKLDQPHTSKLSANRTAALKRSTSGMSDEVDESADTLRNAKVAADVERLINQQLQPLFSPTMLSSFVQRIAPSNSTSFSLMHTTDKHLTEIVQQLRSTAQLHPMYTQLMTQFYSQLFSKCPSHAVQLSTLTFSSPLLVALWYSLESSIGCRLSDSDQQQPTHQIDKQTKARTTSAVKPTAVWCSKILSISETHRHVAETFDLFLRLLLPLLFVMTDDDLVKRHIPFRSSVDLLQLTRLLKMIVYRLLFGQVYCTEQSTSRSFLLQPAKRVLSELYHRDVRASWVQKVLAQHNSSISPSLKAIQPMSTTDSSSFWLLEESADKFAWESEWQAMQRKNLIAANSFVLTIMSAMPYVTSFDQRVELFRRLVADDKRLNHVTNDPIAEIHVRRSQILADGLDAVNQLGSRFKHKVVVKFIDITNRQFEPGMDLSGLFKELMEILGNDVFNTDLGLFKATVDGNYIYPNPHAKLVLPNGLLLLEACGRVVGKCLYDGILINTQFAQFFVNRLLGISNTLFDLQSFDTDLYKQLLFVKHYDGDVSDLSLTFTADAEFLGQHESVDLVPGGSERAVTNENRLEYCYSLADWHLNRLLRQPCQAFSEGLYSTIDRTWLKMFNVHEIRRLMCGSTTNIDVTDWQQHVKYDQCSSSDTQVKWFWQCVEQMTLEEKKALLAYVTSTSNAPLNGFAYLAPPFTIRLVDDQSQDNSSVSTLFRSLTSAVRSAKSDHTALPTASTCFNLLKLPRYPSKKVLKFKLLLAIQHNTGFQLV